MQETSLGNLECSSKDQKVNGLFDVKSELGMPESGRERSWRDARRGPAPRSRTTPAPRK